MNYLLLFYQIVLATVLLIAATGKTIHSEQLAAALRLSHIPKTLITPLVVLLPLLELLLASGLVLGIPRSLPLVISGIVGLLSVFTLWMLTVFMRGLRLKCGCFGAGGSNIGPHTLLRNMLMIAFSAGGLVLSLRVQSPLPVFSPWMIVTVFSLAMCVILLWSLQQAKAALILSVARLANAREDAQSISAL